MTGPTLCALCLREPAVVYCTNDAASLCSACDVQCHSTNPLAARHERIPLGQWTGDGACSRADSDADLAVVPELAVAADDSGMLGDALLGGADDLLLDFGTPGNGLLDFDLTDLFADSPRQQPGPGLDALVPALPMANMQQAPLLPVSGMGGLVSSPQVGAAAGNLSS